jgi:hypothetical protein
MLSMECHQKEDKVWKQQWQWGKEASRVMMEAAETFDELPASDHSAVVNPLVEVDSQLNAQQLSEYHHINFSSVCCTKQTTKTKLHALHAGPQVHTLRMNEVALLCCGHGHTTDQQPGTDHSLASGHLHSCFLCHVTESLHHLHNVVVSGVHLLAGAQEHEHVVAVINAQ